MLLKFSNGCQGLQHQRAAQPTCQRMQRPKHVACWVPDLCRGWPGKVLWHQLHQRQASQLRSATPGKGIKSQLVHVACIVDGGLIDQLGGVQKLVLHKTRISMWHPLSAAGSNMNASAMQHENPDRTARPAWLLQLAAWGLLHFVKPA